MGHPKTTLTRGSKGNVNDRQILLHKIRENSSKMSTRGKYVGGQKIPKSCQCSFWTTPKGNGHEKKTQSGVLQTFKLKTRCTFNLARGQIYQHSHWCPLKIEVSGCKIRRSLTFGNFGLTVQVNFSSIGFVDQKSPKVRLHQFY